MVILRVVHLEQLPERGAWFTRREWRDVLSGGEKQRASNHSFLFLNLALLKEYGFRWEWYYQQPKFAILDGAILLECSVTSL
jgi:ATP-binding cassette subfamily D (ALD) long-chain fatty acid import protein